MTSLAMAVVSYVYAPPSAIIPLLTFDTTYHRV